LRFKKTRLVKFSIDWCTSTKLEQPFRINFSRLELCKFGVLIRCWEWLRLRIFSLLRICIIERKIMKINLKKL
jgi:hypothetical protein